MTNTIKLINLFSNIEATYDNTIVSMHAEYDAPEFYHDENVTMPGAFAVVARYADGATEVVYAGDTDEYGDFNFTATWHASKPGTLRFVYTDVRVGVADVFDDPFVDPDDDSLPF